MRTTLRIDDDLIEEIRGRAREEGVSVARMLNRALRTGLDSLSDQNASVRPFRERPVSLGEPRLDLTKALGVAAALEDEEIARELQMRK